MGFDGGTKLEHSSRLYIFPVITEINFVSWNERWNKYYSVNNISNLRLVVSFIRKILNNLRRNNYSHCICLEIIIASSFIYPNFFDKYLPFVGSGSIPNIYVFINLRPQMFQLDSFPILLHFSLKVSE